MEIEIAELFVYSVSWKGIVYRQATVNINIEIATNGKNQRLLGLMIHSNTNTNTQLSRQFQLSCFISELLILAILLSSTRKVKRQDQIEREDLRNQGAESLLFHRVSKQTTAYR